MVAMSGLGVPEREATLTVPAEPLGSAEANLGVICWIGSVEVKKKVRQNTEFR